MIPYLIKGSDIMPGLGYMSMHSSPESEAFNILCYVVLAVVVLVFIAAMIYIITISKKP